MKKTVLTKQQAHQFCRKWLAAWSGNQPEKLIQFYASNARYRDPATDGYLLGHDQLFAYFKKLLAYNPDWKWKEEEIMLIETGFTLKWKAQIPVADTVIVEYGLDIVEISADEPKNPKITRNEVYFDRAELLSALTNNQ